MSVERVEIFTFHLLEEMKKSAFGKENNFFIPSHGLFDLGNLHNMSYYVWIHTCKISISAVYVIEVPVHTDFLGGP